MLVGIEQQDAIRLDDGLITDEVMGHALTLEADLTDNITLRSLSGWRTWDNRAGDGDLDGNSGLRAFTVSPAIFAPPNPFIPTGVQEIELFTATNRRDQSQFSQEFNVLGEFDAFNFVLAPIISPRRQVRTIHNPLRSSSLRPCPSLSVRV